MHKTSGLLSADPQCDGRASAMRHAAFTTGPAALHAGAGRWVAAPAQAGAACGHSPAQDGAFIALLEAYRPYGGLSRLHALTAGGRIRFDGRDRGVEALVDEGALLGFYWHDDVWIPMFQFDMPGPRVAPGPQRIVAEWGQGFDGWALASWFVQPNAWLASHSPIECLNSRLPEVLAAARADHFASTG
jgi:hypothetical protein